MYSELQSPENELSTDELFERVIDDMRVDDDTRLDALVALLHGRPTRRVVERCLELCTSNDSRERVVGLRVLGELRHPITDPELVRQQFEPTVIRLAEGDDDPAVVRWAVSCLANHRRSRC